PAAGEMVEHADLFDQPPRRVVGRYHSQCPQTKRPGSQRNVGDQKVRRGRIGHAEMMLAEEDALEPRRLGAGPQLEIGIEIALRCLGIELVQKSARRGEELEDPRLDHQNISGVMTFCGRGPTSAARMVSAARRRVSFHASGVKKAEWGVMM